MFNLARGSLYEEIKLERNGTAVSLKGRTVSFSYYESLLSPYVTAHLTYIDVGNGIKGTETDTQERFGTILRSLPVEGRGDENISFKITNELGSLDFMRYPLKIRSAKPISQDSTREVVSLSIVSDAALRNENTRIYEKYYNSISNSVSSILTNKLKVPSSRINVDETKNSLAFDGKSRRPFDAILFCAKQSIPLDGCPGFLFWENQSGFNFRSIDNIISSGVSNKNLPVYRYYGVAKTGLTDQQNNFRILSSPSYSQNQDVLKALRGGIYRTKNVAWNNNNNQYEELYMTIDKAGLKTLGDKPKYDAKFTANNAFTQTFKFYIDSGNNEAGISSAINNNPLEHFAKAAIRYNLFATQVMNITVAANPSLKAGDVIECEFEKITLSNKSEGAADEHQSGKYVILHLCHSFTPTRSFTSLTLVRDTYGLYRSGNL